MVLIFSCADQVLVTKTGSLLLTRVDAYRVHITQSIPKVVHGGRRRLEISDGQLLVDSVRSAVKLMEDPAL